MPQNTDRIRDALDHLRAADPVMQRLIAEVGPFRLRLQRDRFRSLARAIVSQQISTGAARTIRGRLESLVKPNRLTPENLSTLSEEQLRSAGLSRQKAAYLHDLASQCLNGELRLRSIGRLPDDEVVQQLTKVKGIGVWTAQMFLIFSLGRLDVFPGDDLGVKTAIRNLYGLPKLPDSARGQQIARLWRPYASVASWYCWRSLELSTPGPGE